MFVCSAAKRWAARIAAGLAVLATTDAHAVTVSIQGALTVAAGVTDNIENAPTNPPAGQLGRESDLILTVSPGLILTIAERRAVQRFVYTFTGLVYAKHSEADSYNNTFIYSGFFLPSKTTTATLNVSLIQARLSSFNTALDSTTSAAAQPQLANSSNQLSFLANQGFAWDITATWRVYEQVGFGASWILDFSPPQLNGYTVPAKLGIEKAFPRDVVGADVAVQFSDYPTIFGPGVGTGGQVDNSIALQPEQKQLSITPVASWRRDFNGYFTGRASLGATIVLDPRQTDNVFVEPAGTVGLATQYKGFGFDVGYSHLVAPNLLLRSNFVNDSAQVRGTYIFGHDNQYSLALGAGYIYGRQLDYNENITAHVQSIIADATVSWAPLKALSIFLRYQFVDQIGRDTDALPLPSYYRNTLLLGLSAIYPTESAVDMPDTHGNGLRADRTDAPNIVTSKSTNPQVP